NLSSGKVWVGNGMIPSRPVESTAPQGPAGPQGPPGTGEAPPNNLVNNAAGSAISSLVKFGLDQLIGGSFTFLTSLLGSAIGTVGNFGLTTVASVLGSLNKIPGTWAGLGNPTVEDLIEEKLRINARNNSRLVPLGAGAPTASDKTL